VIILVSSYRLFEGRHMSLHGTMQYRHSVNYLVTNCLFWSHVVAGLSAHVNCDAHLQGPNARSASARHWVHEC
jgi:hypothetical protein